MTKKERYRNIIEWFVTNKGKQDTELNYESDFQLLVAVVLSAQCTDKRVNLITPHLFNKYPTALDMSKAKYKDIYECIKSVSYPNSKSKYLVDLSKKLIKDFGGEIPQNTEDMQKLPGVGRKTANVIASVLYGQPKMAVDTHVFRVAKRLGLSSGDTPLKVEMDLTKNIPQEHIANAHHWLILHGRYVCIARKPKCDKCYIAQWCKYVGN